MCPQSFPFIEHKEESYHSLNIKIFHFNKCGRLFQKRKVFFISRNFKFWASYLWLMFGILRMNIYLTNNVDYFAPFESILSLFSSTLAFVKAYLVIFQIEGFKSPRMNTQLRLKFTEKIGRFYFFKFILYIFNRR